MESEVLSRWNKWNQEVLEDPDLIDELKSIQQNNRELEDHFTVIWNSVPEVCEVSLASVPTA